MQLVFQKLPSQHGQVFPTPTIYEYYCDFDTDLRCCEATCAHGIIHKVLRGQQAREHFI